MEDPCPECIDAAAGSQITVVKAEDLPDEVRARLKQIEDLVADPSMAVRDYGRPKRA